jgi:hypothetical protein
MARLEPACEGTLHVVNSLITMRILSLSPVVIIIIISCVLLLPDVARCQYCTLQYCTLQYCTLQYCTLQYCTLQYCTLLYFTVLPAVLSNVTTIHSA